MNKDADNGTITLALATAIAVIEAVLSPRRTERHTGLVSLRGDMERLFGKRCSTEALFDVQRRARDLLKASTGVEVGSIDKAGG